MREEENDFEKNWSEKENSSRPRMRSGAVEKRAQLIAMAGEIKISKGHGPKYESEGQGFPAPAQFHFPGQVTGAESWILRAY